MTPGEKDLATILKTLSPVLNPGAYVYCCVPADYKISGGDVVGTFREEEGITLILKKEVADRLGLEYSVVLSWITLTVHTTLELVGLTAAFSRALATANISCNVVAGVYHDHIFVPEKDGEKAIAVLKGLS